MSKSDRKLAEVELPEELRVLPQGQSCTGRQRQPGKTRTRQEDKASTGFTQVATFTQRGELTDALNYIRTRTGDNLCM